MNEPNDLHDSDLRHLLPVVDRIESAPPELVERLWLELQPMLDDGAADDVTTLQPQRTPPRAERYRWTMFLSAAAAVAVFAAGVVLLTSRDEPARPDPAVADLPSATTEISDGPTTTTPTVTSPLTVGAACDAFRRTVAEPVPFESLDVSSLVDVEPLTAWVDGLGTLLADIDRVGRPQGSADQYLSIQLLRTALRTAVDDVEAGNDTEAATAFANARRHLEANRIGDGSLTGCLTTTGP